MTRLNFQTAKAGPQAGRGLGVLQECRSASGPSAATYTTNGCQTLTCHWLPVVTQTVGVCGAGPGRDDSESAGGLCLDFFLSSSLGWQSLDYRA